ncbi:MAG: hypothetical protein RLY86_2036 [Pseudomonadota bacterium]|jgi:urease accessory protein
MRIPPTLPIPSGRSAALLSALALSLAAGPALAHAGADHHHGSGMIAGLLHPVTGLDHLLAMVMVGLWAAQLGGRALWALPAAFLAVMAAGAGLALAGVAALPPVLTEGGIAASVLILGLLVAAVGRLPTGAAMGLVGGFALLHGLAHGAEFPAGAGPGAYMAGFLLATGGLHAVGAGIGLAVARRWALPVRLAGGGAALAGAALLATL